MIDMGHFAFFSGFLSGFFAGPVIVFSARSAARSESSASCALSMLVLTKRT